MADLIGELPMEGIGGSPLDSDDIWLVTMASVNQSSVWKVTSQTDDIPCDTVMDWLHTLQRSRIEMAANLLFRHLAMTILGPDRSRIVSIDFVDNPYHGNPDQDDGELCHTSPKDGITTCHRYCTAYIVSNCKPVTLALTYVRSDEKEADAVERVLDRIGVYPFEIYLLLADCGFYNERVVRRVRDLATTVIVVKKKGERMKDKLTTHYSYMTTYRMYKDSERELRFLLAISVSYQNGVRGKHGEIVRAT
ncbi:hypothetical protein GCM10009000_037190 [Halobacterium noricense]